MIIPWEPLEESPYGIPLHASKDNENGELGCLYIWEQAELGISMDDEIPKGLSILKEGSYDDVKVQSRWSERKSQNVVRYLLVANRQMSVSNFIDQVDDIGIGGYTGCGPYSTHLKQLQCETFAQDKNDLLSHVYRGIAKMSCYGSRDLDTILLNHVIEETYPKTLERLCETWSNAKLLFSVITDPEFIRVCDKAAQENIVSFLKNRFGWIYFNRDDNPKIIYCE